MDEVKTPTYGVALVLILAIAVHALIMNGFYYVHPGNNVGTYYESVLSKLDPSFFKNSIFVQAINRDNLRISLFFDAAPLFLRQGNFEMVALIQGFISTFFCIAGIFALAYVLFQNISTSCIAALLYTVQLNTWTLGSPAPYLNFFHHSLPYTYPLMIWSLVFFFQKRYKLTMLLAGLSMNFHPMVTMFFLVAYGLYFICRYREFSATTVVLCIIIFIAAASPGIIKTVTHMSASASGTTELWIKGIYWNTWYTCFPFSWPLQWYLRSGCFFALFFICFDRVPSSALKRAMLFLLWAVALMCLIGTVFSEIIPVPVIIKISFWRSTFIFSILALPCIARALQQVFNEGTIRGFCATVLAVFLTGYAEFLPTYYFPVLLCVFGYALYEPYIERVAPVLKGRFPALLIAVLVMVFFVQGALKGISMRVVLFFLSVFLFSVFAAWLQKRYPHFFGPVILGGLFVVLFDAGILIHGGGIPFYYQGYYKGKLDPWADVQKHAAEISHKDDLFLVPPYLNDFGNYSNRATVSDWAEGANIMYLDNRFAEEWFERMHDLGWTQRLTAREGFDKLSTADIMGVAHKYGARYVVTEKPKIFYLKKIYENQKYILYMCENSM